MKGKAKHKITSLREIVSLGTLGTVGNLAAFALPVIVGALVDSLGLNAREGGFVGTAEMVGLGMGTIVFSRVILTVSWRKFATFAILLLAVTNALAPYATDLYVLYGLRVLSGLGGGMLISMGAAGLSSTRSPERVLGSIAIISMLFAGAMLYLLPMIQQAAGIKVMFLTIALINLSLLFAVPLLPPKSPYVAALESSDNEVLNPAGTGAAEAQELPAPTGSPLIRLSTLAGIFLYFTAAMAFWVYVERVGVAAAYTTEQVAQVLGTSQLFGAAGAMTAAILGTRLGNRILPVAFGTLLAATCAFLMTRESQLAVYAIAACGFIFTWSVLYPYFMGIGISLDPSAKLVSYSIVLQTVGKAAGPWLAAMLVTEDSFAPVYWLCCVLFVASLITLLPATLTTDRKLRRV
ncbi:MAG: MFS transporter [Haliea sp.]|uniref:MFS transporter n=1 Tax=Haliea sp. TaxID=1932666 RepID=UPI0032ED4E90